MWGMCTSQLNYIICTWIEMIINDWLIDLLMFRLMNLYVILHFMIRYVAVQLGKIRTSIYDYGPQLKTIISWTCCCCYCCCYYVPTTVVFLLTEVCLISIALVEFLINIHVILKQPADWSFASLGPGNSAESSAMILGMSGKVAWL